MFRIGDFDINNPDGIRAAMSAGRKRLTDISTGTAKAAPGELLELSALADHVSTKGSRRAPTRDPREMTRLLADGRFAGDMPRVKDAGRGRQKGFAPSVKSFGADAFRGLYEASVKRSNFRATLDGSLDGVGVKTPLLESGFGGLPAVIQPGLQQGLLFEPTRIFDHIPVQAMDSPSISFLVHESNTNPAAIVAEGGLKPDLGLVLDAKTITATKIAALASLSDEALQDYQSFLAWLPNELTQAIVNVENATLISQILGTSGILTHAVGTDTPLDAVEIAITLLRTGAAYAALPGSA